MKIKDTRATSIAESIVIMLIVVTGVVGMYNIFTESTKLSNTTKNRIEAIQIAREGIEAIINIRNTNWILYAADNKNCWNTINYNNNCIGNTENSKSENSTDIGSGSYIIYKDLTNRWDIKQKSTGKFNSFTYRRDFEVKKDKNGFYTQNGGTNFKPLFTREIKITYPEDTNLDNVIDSNDEKIKIISLVQWIDGSSEKEHKVEIETILTNWEKF